MGTVPPKPPGGRGLRAISLSFVVNDASHPLLFSPRPLLSNLSHKCQLIRGSGRLRLRPSTGKRRGPLDLLTRPLSSASGV